jgi:hypothetical protein
LVLLDFLAGAGAFASHGIRGGEEKVIGNAVVSLAEESLQPRRASRRLLPASCILVCSASCTLLCSASWCVGARPLPAVRLAQRCGLKGRLTLASEARGPASEARRSAGLSVRRHTLRWHPNTPPTPQPPQPLHARCRRSHGWHEDLNTPPSPPLPGQPRLHAGATPPSLAGPVRRPTNEQVARHAARCSRQLPSSVRYSPRETGFHHRTDGGTPCHQSTEAAPNEAGPRTQCMPCVLKVPCTPRACQICSRTCPHATVTTAKTGPMQWPQQQRLSRPPCNAPHASAEVF